jgi:hypothetical protein
MISANDGRRRLLDRTDFDVYSTLSTTTSKTKKRQCAPPEGTMYRWSIRAAEKKVNGKLGLFQVCFRYFRSVFSNSTHRLRCYRAREEEISIFICARTVLFVAVQSEALIRLMLGSEY